MFDFDFGVLSSPEEPRNGGYRRDSRLITESFLDEAIPHLPAEHPGVLDLVAVHPTLDLRRGKLGLRTSDHTGPDRAGLLVSEKATEDELLYVSN